MKQISLTADEVMILTDRVLNADTGTEPHGLQAFPLLLRLGSAYVEMLGDGRRAGEIPVAISESEAWLLRSKITSGDKTGNDPLFGVKLLTKIYRVLLAFNAPPDVLPDGPADEDAKMSEFSKQALGKWVERHQED